ALSAEPHGLSGLDGRHREWFPTPARTAGGSKSGCWPRGFCATIREPHMAAAKFYPTTSGVSLRDLGAAVVPLARNVASIQVPGLRAQSPVFASWTVTLACNLGCAHCSFNRPLPDELPHAERLEVARRPPQGQCSAPAGALHAQPPQFPRFRCADGLLAGARGQRAPASRARQLPPSGARSQLPVPARGSAGIRTRLRRDPRALSILEG